MNLGVITERSQGETCGVWKTDLWKPDVAWFRCRECNCIVPESLFEGADAENKFCAQCRGDRTSRGVE